MLKRKICPKCSVRYRPQNRGYCTPCKNKAGKLRTRQIWINYLKTHSCVDCGESDIVVLGFDHVRGKKIANVSKISRGGSIKVLEREIRKCDVVCSNCHSRRTAARSNWYINLVI